MRLFPRLPSWRTLRYRLVVMGVALAYLLAALEIPLPVAVAKDTSQPFPCQDHPCGCQTAEQCWSRCCCFTPEERWAWAREHDVQPPAYAEKPATPPVEPVAVHGWNTVKLRDRDRGETPPAEKSCCRKQPGRSACCQTRSPSAVKESPSSGNNVRWGAVAVAWRCQGTHSVWVSVGAVLPVAPLAGWSPDCQPPVLFSLSDRHASILSMTPPAPPPRLSLV